mmetsp:Transcript_61432/g.168698  ORF Transcript_61432/g.168698 Transcript_61432/m.168698 type:complete len:400 (+) Transcript_61432:433-1632(+)
MRSAYPRLVACVAYTAGLLVAGQSALPDWPNDPEVLHGRALSYAHAGDTQTALTYFRAACRLATGGPLEASFLSDLGVSEMRLGRLFDARDHFVRALELDPSLDTAQMNSRDLRAYLGEERWARDADAAARPGQRRHRATPIRRVPLAEMSTRDLDAPVIVVDAFPLLNSSTLAQRFGPERLRRNFPRAAVDFYPQGLDLEWMRPTFTNLGSALDWQNATTSANFPSYIQLNLDPPTWAALVKPLGELPAFIRDGDDSWMAECLHDPAVRSRFLKGTHWHMLLIGEEGSGNGHRISSPLHDHHAANRRAYQTCPNNRHVLAQGYIKDCELAASDHRPKALASVLAHPRPFLVSCWGRGHAGAGLRILPEVRVRPVRRWRSESWRSTLLPGILLAPDTHA